jgi:hypothetical protein
MRRLACLAVAAAAALGSPETTHTGILKTATFDVKYRPGSRAGAAAERDGAAAERDFKDICTRLAFTPEGRFTLWLYDDVPELQAITGNRMAGAFSAGRDSHLPFGDDQTRYHEMVHLVAHCLPKSGDEARGMFLVEGLANALLVHVHGVHVHAVARFYRGRKELPPLATFLAADFYAWLKAHPGFNAYDVAGSFVLFLIDAHGIEALKRYYTGTPAKDALGADERALEAAWLKAIDAFVLRPEVETLLKQRAGEAAKFDVYALDPDARIPPTLLGKPSDWKPLAGEKLAPRDDVAWKREGEALVASGTGEQWHICDLGARKYKDCAVRARVVTKDVYGGVQLQLGDGCQALVVGNGTFVYRNGAGTAMNPAARVTPTGEVDLLMVRRGNRLEVWVDGFRLAEGPVDDEAAPIAIGVHSGTARFENVRVRELK